MDIQGVGAVVTGGASGLGAATAERLARAGARVTIFDMNPDLGSSLAERIHGRFAPVDVTGEVAVDHALDEAAAAHGTTRILVNCAGIAPPGKVIDRSGAPLPLAAFARVVAVNLTGTFNVVSRFAARLHEAELVGEERGVVVNTASVAAFDGQVGQAAYAASKGGVVGMTLPLARELARYAVRVMTIAPGLFWTPLMDSLPPQAQESLGRQAPFPNRLGRPDEYAQLVEAIVTNPMLNGEVVRLDGAIRMAPR